MEIGISIHAPREGGDPEEMEPFTVYDEEGFQSTPPARGATLLFLFGRDLRPISIHAPREGGDDCRPWGRISLDPISIHAPREGGDVMLVCTA